MESLRQRWVTRSRSRSAGEIGGVIDAAQPADDVLQVTDGAVLGNHDQFLDELRVAALGVAADGADLRVGQPPGGHRGLQRVGGEGASDTDVLDRGTRRDAAVVRQPAGSRGQSELRAPGSRVESRDQQQPPTGRRGQSTAQPDDARTELFEPQFGIAALLGDH